MFLPAQSGKSSQSLLKTSKLVKNPLDLNQGDFWVVVDYFINIFLFLVIIDLLIPLKYNIWSKVLIIN